MEELLAKYPLSQDQLDSELQQEDLLILANYFDKDAADRCIHAIPTLSPADKGDAQEKAKTSTAMTAHHCLSTWRQHEPSEATYNALLVLVLSEKFNKRSDIAEDICKHLADKYDIETNVSIVARREISLPPIGIPSDANDHSSLGSNSSGIQSASTQEKYVTFTCGCGKCSILGYISGKDNCSSTKPAEIKIEDIQLPRSSSTAILEEHVMETQISQGIFKRALQKETLRMHTSFSKLLHETFEELEEKCGFCKVKSFTKTLLCGNYFDPIKGTVDPCDKLNDFEQLHEYIQNNYCSWFNYDLIKALREQFLFSPELDQALDKYEKVFKEYVTRRCFLYTDHLAPHPQVDSVEVVCKIDVDFASIAYNQIKDIALSFIECVHIPKYSLLLRHVTDGCTELHFRLVGTHNYTFTLSPHQKEHLRALDFISITVGSQEIIGKELTSNNDLMLNSSSIFGKGDKEYMLLEKFQTGDDPITAVVFLDAAAKEGVDVDLIFDEDGMTLLHLACQWDWSKWGIVVERLVKQHDCDILARNHDDETPLDVAVQFNNVGAIKYFTTLDPHIPVENALQIAHERQHEDCLRVLTQVAGIEHIKSLFQGSNTPPDAAAVSPLGEPTAKKNKFVIARKLRSPVGPPQHNIKPSKRISPTGKFNQLSPPDGAKVTKGQDVDVETQSTVSTSSNEMSEEAVHSKGQGQTSKVKPSILRLFNPGSIKHTEINIEYSSSEDASLVTKTDTINKPSATEKCCEVSPLLMKLSCFMFTVCLIVAGLIVFIYFLVTQT